MFDLAIIGAGAAGLMAAVYAAQAGAKTCVFEKNSAAGKKLLLTGGGRCNLTHTGSIDDFIKACHPFGNTLRHAFYALRPADLIDFFARRGLETAAEPDGCIFPRRGCAEDVLRILLGEVNRCGAAVYYGARVAEVSKNTGGFQIKTAQASYACKCVVIAAGGASWPQTGSTGDGYKLAETFGHTVIEPIGILCPVVCSQPWPGRLQGISLERVSIRMQLGGKRQTVTGAAVFTADGIGGPAAFDVSRAAAETLRRGNSVPLWLNFCPDCTAEMLEAQIIRHCAEHPQKDLAGILSLRLPRRIGELLQEMTAADEPVCAGHLRRQQRRRLVELLSAMPLTAIRCAPLEKATVTRGGICRSQIDFRTMQSRLCEGLFFAGEVIDVDGPCGGYNLQIAFSTGALAGMRAAGCARLK